MNKALTLALAERESLQKEFEEKGADKIYQEILNRAHRKATTLLAEGSVHLTLGNFTTNYELEEKRRNINL
jgi:1,2-phenylacetyl-CoA epoxidase PaaB subunit